MKRQLVVLACFAFLAIPALADEPFGQFDPSPTGESAAGIKRIHGWALDDDGIESVDIYVDGRPAGRADFGRARTDVPKRFPGYPDSNAAGWAFALDTTRYLNKNHRVTVRLRSKTGEVVFLPAQVFQFVNVDHNLDPFGEMDFPSEQAELRGNCNLADANRRYSVFSGWALDSSVTPLDAGIGYLELYIDGALTLNTLVNCVNSPVTGLFTNCYGLRRLDVEEKYGELVNSPHSGFRFVLDVGFLMSGLGYGPGAHEISIRAGDRYTQDVVIDKKRVTFMCDEDILNEQAKGRVGEPKNGRMFSGVINVLGWALDWEGIHVIAIHVDGELAGFTVPNLPRATVTSLYPGYPDSAFPGFSFALDTSNYSDGQHHIQIIVVDVFGHTTIIGERSVFFANDGTDCGSACS